MPPELAQWIVPLIVVFGTLSPAVVVGLMLYLHRVTRQDVAQLRDDVRQDMKDLESRLESKFDSRMDRMEARLRDDMKRLDGRVGRLEHSQAKLEGLLAGLREAITRQPAA